MPNVDIIANVNTIELANTSGFMTSTMSLVSGIKTLEFSDSIGRSTRGNARTEIL
jgi:hypothetical protein